MEDDCLRAAPARQPHEAFSDAIASYLIIGHLNYIAYSEMPLAEFL